MKQKIILGLMIFTFLFVFSGCASNPEEEAKEIVTEFFKEAGLTQEIIDEEVVFLNFYERGDYWFYELAEKGLSHNPKYIVILEINKNTKKVEWISDDGERFPADEIFR